MATQQKSAKTDTKLLAGIKYQEINVPLGDLSVHPKVQRAFRPKWAAAIAKDFDESALDLLWVSREGGHLYIFDGQHRFGAVKLYLGDGWETIPIRCRVYDNLDTPTLATLTGAKNAQLSWTAIAEFRREVLALDPAAMDIARILKASGLVVREDTTPQTVRAVTALRQVYAWRPDGPHVLAYTVALLHEAWPNHGAALHQSLLKGVGTLVLRHGQNIDRANLLHRLSAHSSPDIVLGQARAYARATGISVTQAIASVVLRSYNTGRRSGKLEE